MKTTTALTAFATSATLALTLGLATAAHAGDFDFGHPDQDLLQLARPAAPMATPEQAAAQRVAITATTLQRRSSQRVGELEPGHLAREDSGLFWLTQHPAHPRSAAAVAKVDAGLR